MKNNPAGIYLLKVSNRNTRARCETCSKLTIKIPERRHVIAGWEMFKRTMFSIKYKDETKRQSAIRVL